MTKETGDITLRIEVKSARTFGKECFELIQQEIHSGSQLHAFIFALHNAPSHPNTRGRRQVLVCLAKFDNGKTFLFDQHQLNLSKTIEEYNVLAVIENLCELNLSNKIFYATTRVDDDVFRNHPIEIDREIMNLALKPLIKNWQEFLMFNCGNMTTFTQGIYQDDEWQQLALKYE